jgi:glycosyltransferase involved in cell wall biosynthesis
MTSPLITLMTSSYKGGIGRSLANLANALYRLGYRIDILVDKQEFPYAREVADGINIRRLRTSHRIGGIGHLLSYVIRYKPNVVLTPFVQLTVLTVRTRSLFRMPLRIYANLHSTYSVDFTGLPPEKRKRRITDMKKYYPRCDGIIAVSKGVAEDFSNLTGIPGEKIKTIHNPIVTDALIQSSENRPDHEWFSPGQPPVLLGMGRLIDSKNFDELIHAFITVRREKECRLVLLGDGPARAGLEQLANTSPFAKDIMFMGHQDNPFPFLRYSSILVLSSSYEGLPSTLIESLAVGTPVVSTDCPHGPREILEDGRFGELVSVHDPAALSEAIKRTIENPLDGSTLKTAAEKFRDTSIAGSYLTIFGLT